MNSLLLSIVGVVFIGVLFDLIYPNGKTNNLCKSIFSIIAVLIMVSSILNIDIDKINVDKFVDNELVEHVNDAKIDTIKLKIINHLSSCGIDGVVVRIDSNLTEEEFIIEKIYLDATNLVLSDNVKNINKYDVIVDEVSSLLKIDNERIIVYG